MRTIVYVDGFNLYYGCLKNTQYKWLDLPLLFENILHPMHDIQLVRYFTARVSESLKDKQKSHRQRLYLNALKNTGLI